MTSATLTEFAAHEESAARTLTSVVAAAETLVTVAIRRADGAELTRLRSFGLSVTAMAEANSQRAAVWAGYPVEQDKATHLPAPPPPEFQRRIADAASLDDLAAIVDEAETGCAGLMARGLAGLAGTAVRLQVARAIAAIGEGLALTRAAIEKDPAPWPNVPAG